MALSCLLLAFCQATGGSDEKKDLSISKLNRVHQLSGFSDPVYAEAYVAVHQYDIVLDGMRTSSSFSHLLLGLAVLLVNQTNDTLQNLTIELATLGDLKLTEKPTPRTLAPRDFCNIKANVKVSSTEQGIIFGSIVYDVSGATSDRNCVVLNDIHIDIMVCLVSISHECDVKSNCLQDYIVSASCSETDFRSMWSEFEWENKVVVRTSLTSLRAYLDHLLGCTNMRCLTPQSALEGECDFLSANLYAKSVFGEDALANLSIEKMADGAVCRRRKSLNCRNRVADCGPHPHPQQDPGHRA